MPPKNYTLELLDFIATEATHDSFYNMVDLIDQKKGGYDLKELIDELGKKCSLKETTRINPTLNVPFNNTPPILPPSKVFKNSYFANNVGITEFKMDEVLLGEKRHVLCSKYNSRWHNIQVPSIDYETMKVSKINAEIQHFTGIACKFSDTIMINTMFSKVNRNPRKDIYFVCDSASELIGKFSKTPYFPHDINVHVMISSATLADPSSRITQFSRHNISNPIKGNKYIHTYDDSIDLKKCDKFGLLDFDITHSLYGPTKADYTVNETFEYSETGLPTGQRGPGEPYPSKRTLNPSDVATGKKLVQCEIGKGILNHKNCGKPDGKPAKKPFYMSMIRGLRIAQYKRMGDHQQIRFIRWLWDKPNFEKSQTLYHSNTGRVIPTTTTNTTNLNSFVRPGPTNCFFVTGDYPAFEYAIFHRINAIIKTSASNGSKRGMLMVRFN